jgi:hypothetical protein
MELYIVVYKLMLVLFVIHILVHWIMSVMKVRFVAQLVPVSVTLATGALEDGVAMSMNVLRVLTPVMPMPTVSTLTAPMCVSVDWTSLETDGHAAIWTNVHWDLWIVLRILFAFKLLQGHFPVSVYLISQELIVVVRMGQLH